jgi:hypothetical protein
MVSCTATAAFLAADVCVNAHQLSGSGAVEYKVFSPTNPAVVLDQRTFRFRLGTSNDVWQIRTEPVPERDVPYVEASCDGTNTYLIIKIGERALSKVDSRINRAKIADVIAEVYPTDFPPPRREPITPVWLAYCASQHLASLASSGKNVFPPLWHYPKPAMYLLDYTVRASFTALNTDPFILRTCTEFSDGAEYDIAPGRIPSVVQIYRYPTPYDSGYPRVKYQVNQVTNVAGYAFPEGVTLQTLAPRQHDRSVDDLALRCQYEGTLESFTYGQSDLKIGEGLKPFADVVDYRTLKLTPPS